MARLTLKLARKSPQTGPQNLDRYTATQTIKKSGGGKEAGSGGRKACADSSSNRGCLRYKCHGYAMRPKYAMARGVVHNATKYHNATKVPLLRLFYTSHDGPVHRYEYLSDEHWGTMSRLRY